MVFGLTKGRRTQKMAKEYKHCAFEQLGSKPFIPTMGKILKSLSVGVHPRRTSLVRNNPIPSNSHSQFLLALCKRDLMFYYLFQLAFSLWIVIYLLNSVTTSRAAILPTTFLWTIQNILALISSTA